MSRPMTPPLRGRIDACTDPTVMKQTRINQLDVGEESIDELLGGTYGILYRLLGAPLKLRIEYGNIPLKENSSES